MSGRGRARGRGAKSGAARRSARKAAASHTVSAPPPAEPVEAHLPLEEDGDSLAIHPQSDEEETLEAEYAELQRVHQQVLRDERAKKIAAAKAASDTRCNDLRSKISALAGQINSIKARRASGVEDAGGPTAPRQPGPAAAGPPAAALGRPPTDGAQRAFDFPVNVPGADQWGADSDVDPDELFLPGRYHPLPANRPVKSGLVARSTDNVRYPQTWPHVALQDEFFNQALEFKELDFRLFVAGELEIATSPDISDRERTGRLLLLKQLAYLHGVHDWGILRNIYLSVVRKIEMGSLHWGSSFMHDIQWILTKHTVTQASRTSRPITKAGRNNAPDKKIWYCIDYNRGKCAFRENHYSNINGQQEWVTHTYSHCYKRDGSTPEHPRIECKK